MRPTLLFLFLFIQPLSATYILFFSEDKLEENKRSELFDLLLQGEPPRSFYLRESFDLEKACHALVPSLRLEWIPPSVWQLVALHAFFHDREIQEGILACAKSENSPLIFDIELQNYLSAAASVEKFAEFFDEKSRSLPDLATLFFRINKAAVNLFKRAEGSDLAMARLAISELPPFAEWPSRKFPFWDSPWIHNKKSAEIFHAALTDDDLLLQLLKIEHAAHSQNKWVLYRGYTGSGFPTTLEMGKACSHALSFGSTLLGGTFFSLEATALTYAKPHASEGAWSFLALTVTPEKLKELFRVGPLHPFLQLLVDGEMFHAHTKIAELSPDGFKTCASYGYFMACNKHCLDPLGYILALNTKPDELEQKFQALCNTSGVIFPANSESFAR